MNRPYSRREMLRRTGQAVLLGGLGMPFCVAARGKPTARWEHGAVVGENPGMRVGEKVLAEGGNAIDAAVAAALAVSMAAPARSGIGGYGGHMIIALAGGKKVTAIDFNTAAPAAAGPDMFPLDGKGAAKGRIHFFGWVGGGVPCRSRRKCLFSARCSPIRWSGARPASRRIPGRRNFIYGKGSR